MMKKILLLILVCFISRVLAEGAAAAGKSDDQAESRAAEAEQPAEVYCTHLEVIFKNGNSYQANTVLMEVPGKYSGWYITLSRWGDSDQPLKFKVRKAGVVTLANLPARARRYLREEGWMEAGRFAIYNTVKEKQLDYVIMEKYLEEGTYIFDGADNEEKRHPLLIRKP